MGWGELRSVVRLLKPQEDPEINQIHKTPSLRSKSSREGGGQGGKRRGGEEKEKRRGEGRGEEEILSCQTAFKRSRAPAFVSHRPCWGRLLLPLLCQPHLCDSYKLPKLYFGGINSTCHGFPIQGE